MCKRYQFKIVPFFLVISLSFFRITVWYNTQQNLCSFHKCLIPVLLIEPGNTCQKIAEYLLFRYVSSKKQAPVLFALRLKCNFASKKFEAFFKPTSTQMSLVFKAVYKKERSVVEKLLNPNLFAQSNWATLKKARRRKCFRNQSLQLKKMASPTLTEPPDYETEWLRKD